MEGTVPWSQVLARTPRPSRRRRLPELAAATPTPSPEAKTIPITDQIDAILGGSAEETIHRLWRVEKAVRELRLELERLPFSIFDQLVADVCGEYEVTREEILGRARPDRIAYPRQVLMVLLTRCGVTLERTGKLVGGRDHATTHHAITAVENRVASYPKEKVRFEALVARAATYTHKTPIR